MKLIHSCTFTHACAFLAVLAGGCHKNQPPAQPSAVDADANSGPDAKRSGAVAIQPNQPVSDEVSWEKQDRTDWKSLELRGTGILEVDLRWDNDAADINLSVFNSFGEEVATTPARGNEAHKRLAVPVDAPGVYYLRVQAAPPKGGSIYYVVPTWGQPKVVEKAEPPTPAAPKPHHEHHRRPSGEGGLQGRIVSSYREGGATVLHLDKGSSAGVQVGQSGSILEGPSGVTPLDGGSFEIIKVIDEARSIAKTQIHSIGHNTRVSINTSR
jgi:hypothetical protein